MTQIALAFELSPPQPRRRPQTPVGEEIARLSHNAERVLELLQDGLWHRNIDLVAVGGIRAVGRVWDLQRAGHRIEKRHIDGGNWEYRLIRP